MRPYLPREFWSDRRNPAQHLSTDDAQHLSTNERGFGSVDGTTRSRFSTSSNSDKTVSPAGGECSLLDSGKPMTICVPDKYEPGYAYPLIIWLHGDGGSERELWDLMPAISTQNYFGLSFRGTVAVKNVGPGGYGWPQSEPDVAAFETQLYEDVCQLRREFHVHSERIYLAGFDAGATMSLQLLLRRPNWFAGAIAFSGRFPQSKLPLSRYRDLHGKQILIGTGSRDRSVSAVDVVRAGRLLHAAGMEVTTRIYDAAHEVTPQMLDHVNHWVMDGIGSLKLV